MSGKSIQRDIEGEMRANGFWLHRRGTHNIWTNGKDTIVTSRSPSCRRVLKNIKSMVRRYAKAKAG